ncbi:hypothetical protein KXD40_008215 [Peronospora effusa]|uniref:Uncharacterized protein n=1 Tax=Peronospora effusa TaxID=542832 RepID=A0A3M6VAQ4_9STRA|nr:hypothetical protein DD238_004334 [Peronospora effusa]RQM17098.1 hypothetical protein DD237_001162 [Peronospora effusa]UIZ24161.1 hypothetical protein KXD40_008215 [Peronospora effusa]
MENTGSELSLASVIACKRFISSRAGYNIYSLSLPATCAVVIAITPTVDVTNISTAVIMPPASVKVSIDIADTTVLASTPVHH